MQQCLGLAAGVAAASVSGAVDPAALPPAASGPVSFDRDIAPLFERTCLRCHGPERPRSGFRLDDRDLALRGGHEGVAIIPGDSAASPLIHFVAGLVEDMEMPPVGQGDPWTPEEIGLVRAWIDQGAAWSEAPSSPQITASVTTAVQFFTVSGNVARFREHLGTAAGWGGGVADFALKYDLDAATRVTMSGRAMAGPDDYRFETRVERDELGWVRVAYREFSRFHDDTGGYDPALGVAAPRLGEELVVRRRHATIEVGLDLPDWPDLRLAYDLHTRDGTEATLHWGAVSRDVVTRAVFPGRKRVDETTHRLTFEVGYDWNGLLISDQAQFEWHDQDNLRTSYEFADPPFDFATRTRDRQDAWRGANVLRLEKSVRDWLYLSGGYLFSQLRDVGGFSVESFAPSDPTLPPSLDWNADGMTLRRRSHVANANAMLGPWEKLHFYAGLQAEWTRQEGFAGGTVFGARRTYDANLDRAATEETFGLRYAGLPWTVLYVETRFQQDSISQFEEGLADETQAFLRDTDATGNLHEVVAGFSISPWRPVSLHARYRHRDRRDDYEHPRDVDVFSSGNGYPAFIRSRRTETDEVEARVVWQVRRGLKATVKYGVAATDYRTRTDDWEDFRTFPPTPQSGGSLLAGQYDAHTLSAGLVVNPWSRLYWAPTLSWTDSRSLSGVNNDREVAPYKGHAWHLLQTATFLVDEKSDLLATYLYSSANYGQENSDFTLPLGITYTRHAATLAVTRRFHRDRLLRLEYGFFGYDEPTLGGAADYTAHGFFASFRLPWP